MITCKELFNDKVSGYLGNKLFIVSAMIGYAQKNNTLVNIPKKVSKEYYKVFKNFPKNISKINDDDYYDYYEMFYECDPTFLDTNVGGKTNINGYFQSKKYWSHCVDVVRNTFEFSDDFIDSVSKSDLANIIKNNRTCSIHVRRGDYLKYSNVYYQTPLYYYKRCVDQIANDVDCFIIFSNDIEYCKKVFKSNKFIFSDFSSNTMNKSKSQFEDFALMSMCDHNIITNSTFSWWSSFLNKNENKKVFAPTKWFVDGKNTKDLYLKSWILK